MFASILNVLKNSNGYVNFTDICGTLERDHSQEVAQTNDLESSVREALIQAHKQGLIFKSDDRYKFAVNFSTSEDARFASRLEAVKRERLSAKNLAPPIPNPADEIAGPSGYSYWMVPEVSSQPVEVRNTRGALLIEDGQNQQRRPRGRPPGRGRSRSRSSSREQIYIQ